MGVDHPGLGFSLQDLVRMVRREALAALQNSSIGRKGIRFYDGGRALFQGGGGVEVQEGGFIDLDGDLTGTGLIDWLGNMILRGTLNVVGASALGATLTVTNGGEIVLGNMTLTPSSNGGSVKFAGGPEIYADGPNLNLYAASGGAWLELGPTEARLFGPGVEHLRVTNTGFQMVNLPTKTAAATGLPAGVLHADPNGNLYRII